MHVVTRPEQFSMSMQSVVSPAHRFTPPKRNSLTHIPGDAGWPIIGKPGEMLVYPAMKQLALDLAATSFLGAGIGPEVDEINRAFIDMVAAAVAPIRKPLPGTQMGRGVKGRKRIVAYFSEQIPIRRAKGGEDLFSQLC